VYNSSRLFFALRLNYSPSSNDVFESVSAVNSRLKQANWFLRTAAHEVITDPLLPSDAKPQAAVLGALTTIVVRPAQATIASELASLATDVIASPSIYKLFVTECSRDDKDMYSLCFRKIQGVRTSQRVREASVKISTSLLVFVCGCACFS
jgi:hypothetical protein